MSRALTVSIAIALFAGCDAHHDSPDAGSADDAGLDGITTVAPDPQRSGDADAGYYELVNGDYISCGVPYSLATEVFGGPVAGQTLTGRAGDNPNLPFYVNAVTAASGVEVVAPNCLSCHAEQINGQFWVGLGNVTYDYTSDPSSQLEAAVSFVSDPTQKAELQKFADRMSAVGPYTTLKTVGVNPADNLAAALFAHHDQQTLAWSDTPLLAAPSTNPAPVRVPPWWRMKKKNAMFYNTAGRGDHARIMMTATTLCTDTVAQATAIDSYFPDIEAFILSVQAPPYPFPVNATLAAQGQTVFEATCTRCHGTYGGGGTYPNYLVPLSEVGTDPVLANTSQFGSAYVDWYNGSFYGQLAHLDPQPGYLAPPLDGIWAVAPYFHNGSVPTLEGVLDSSSRPTYWSRTFDSTDYDQTNVGWNITVAAAGGATNIYDTTQPGYSNAGHTFGDGLSASDRMALIEYLKTL